LTAPGDSAPSPHSNFVARCVESSSAPSGFECGPVFYSTHDGETKLHDEVLPIEYVRPPYDEANFYRVPWLFKAVRQNTVEQLYLGLYARHYETIPTLQNPLSFAYSGIVGGTNLSPVLRFETPFGCLHVDGPCTTSPAHPLDMNGGLRDLASRGSRLLLTAAPPAPYFDSKLRVIRAPAAEVPTLGKVLRNDGTGWIAVEFPPNALPPANDELPDAPYDYMLDRVFFITDDVALVVGHYRTCLSAGCDQTTSATTVTLRVQPFVATFRFGPSTFGSARRLGEPVDLTCCIGDACELNDCFGSESWFFRGQYFFSGANIQLTGIRTRTDGIEIYLLRNRLVVLDANSWEPWPVNHEVFTFISSEK
ncbi:MAG: hypothetical protein KC609_24585, partial [Myxococcales bacterium]|nr:hypothetical protein [Myxococcales bacterium]